MPSKQIEIANLGLVTVTKRSSSRSIRIKLPNDGSIAVTIPAWARYKQGIDFALAHQEWIQKHKVQPTFLKNGMPIGKQRLLHCVPTRNLQKPRSLVTEKTVMVRYPVYMSIDDIAVQTIAQAACIRALRKEAEQTLLPRLAELAALNGFSYTNARVKPLQSRWGSCDQKQNIVLNIYLVQLPQHCIDYVLLHELLHTRILQHGSIFWGELQKYVPKLNEVRKEMKTHKPVLQ